MSWSIYLLDTSKFIKVDILIFQFKLESRYTPRHFVLFTWGIFISSIWSAGLALLPKTIQLVFVINNESWFAWNQSVSLSLSFWSSNVAWITFLSLFTKLRCKSLTKLRIAEVQAHYLVESPHLSQSDFTVFVWLSILHDNFYLKGSLLTNLYKFQECHTLLVFLLIYHGLMYQRLLISQWKEQV